MFEHRTDQHFRHEIMRLNSLLGASQYGFYYCYYYYIYSLDSLSLEMISQAPIADTIVNFKIRVFVNIKSYGGMFFIIIKYSLDLLTLEMI